MNTMGRRRFFGMLFGLAAALALPIRNVRGSLMIGERTWVTPGFFPLYEIRWSRREVLAIFPKGASDGKA